MTGGLVLAIHDIAASRALEYRVQRTAALPGMMTGMPFRNAATLAFAVRCHDGVRPRYRAVRPAAAYLRNNLDR